MLYLLHQGERVSSVGDLEPARSERWRRGQILYFSIDRLPCAPTPADALLIDASGVAWHLRILMLTRPRSSHPQAVAGVIAWLRDRSQATPAVLSVVRTSLPRACADLPSERRGAA